MVNPPPPPPPMDPGEYEFEPQQPDRETIRQRVNGPAIALMAYGGLSVLSSLLGLVNSLLVSMGIQLYDLDQFGNYGDIDPQFQQMLNMTSGVSGLFGAVIGLVIAGVMIFGAMKMRNLQLWGFSLAAAILAIIPCFGCCCLIGMPIGIWATVILFDADVKAAFTN